MAPKSTSTRTLWMPSVKCRVNFLILEWSHILVLLWMTLSERIFSGVEITVYPFAFGVVPTAIALYCIQTTERKARPRRRNKTVSGWTVYLKDTRKDLVDTIWYIFANSKKWAKKIYSGGKKEYVTKSRSRSRSSVKKKASSRKRSSSRRRSRSRRKSSSKTRSSSRRRSSSGKRSYSKKKSSGQKASSSNQNDLKVSSVTSTDDKTQSQKSRITMKSKNDARSKPAIHVEVSLNQED